MGKQSRLLALVLAVLVGAVYLIINNPPKLGLDLRGGAQLTLQAKINPEQGINEITPKLMETARFVVEQRINGLGVSEATILLSANNQMIVQLPGVSDPAQAERVIGTTAQLDFRKQKKGTESELRARLQIQQAATIQREVLKASNDAKAIAENEAAYKKSIEDLKGLFETTGFTGNMLKDAVAAPTGNGGNDSWQVALTFDDKGGELFAKTTAELGGTGRVLGIFLDEKLISYPSVGPEFQGKGISGGRAG
jgi:preprotein translocase subunit SecD